jgi:hypothetical protein
MARGFRCELTSSRSCADVSEVKALTGILRRRSLATSVAPLSANDSDSCTTLTIFHKSWPPFCQNPGLAHSQYYTPSRGETTIVTPCFKVLTYYIFIHYNLHYLFGDGWNLEAHALEESILAFTSENTHNLTFPIPVGATTRISAPCTAASIISFCFPL